MSHPLVTALKADLAGCQKLAAHAVWPDLSMDAAESRLSRVLAGELNPPAELLEFALSRPTKILALYCAERSRRDPAELREHALRIAESAREQLLLFQGLMTQADEIEAERAPRQRKPAMAKVGLRPEQRRERA